MTFCETNIHISPTGTERTTQCFTPPTTRYTRSPCQETAWNTNYCGTSAFRMPSFYHRPSYTYYTPHINYRRYSPNAAFPLAGGIVACLGLTLLAALSKAPICSSQLVCDFWDTCYWEHYCL